jgi:3-oxoacyl-[acyl-carrier protein] reductase
VKLAVVTGGSRGIGLEVARGWVSRGGQVMVTGTGPKVHDAAATLSAEGPGEAVGIVSDTSHEQEVAELARLTLQRGVPELVVLNAGVVRRGPRVDETALEDWERVLAVNLSGPFLVARAFLPAMRAAGRGRLVFVGSISSTIGCAANASYAASKWGVVGLMKSVAEETRGTGLVVSAVLPGSVDTEMLAGSGFEPAMTAADVAGTILYLGVDAPPAIHGSAVEMFG